MSIWGGAYVNNGQGLEAFAGDQGVFNVNLGEGLSGVFNAEGQLTL